MTTGSRRFEPDYERAAGETIDGEAIIINLVTGAYYSMRGIGGELWSMIEQRRSIASIIDSIVARYDVEPAEAEADLEGLIAQLLSEGLIRPTDAAEIERGEETTAARSRYERPQLQVFRDMEDLLALDPPAPGMNDIAWKKQSAERE